MRGLSCSPDLTHPLRSQCLPRWRMPFGVCSCKSSSHLHFVGDPSRLGHGTGHREPSHVTSWDCLWWRSTVCSLFKTLFWRLSPWSGTPDCNPVLTQVWKVLFLSSPICYRSKRWCIVTFMCRRADIALQPVRKYRFSKTVLGARRPKQAWMKTNTAPHKSLL